MGRAAGHNPTPPRPTTQTLPLGCQHSSYALPETIDDNADTANLAPL